MTSLSPPERCEVCDRAECTREFERGAWDPASGGGDYAAAMRDCTAHAVNWRDRALKAEALLVDADEDGAVRGHGRQRYLCGIDASGSGGGYAECDTRKRLYAAEALLREADAVVGPALHARISAHLNPTAKETNDE
jgi:hypothetical protein